MVGGQVEGKKLGGGEWETDLVIQPTAGSSFHHYLHTGFNLHSFHQYNYNSV